MDRIQTLCVELTSRCALRCIHCSANAAPERRDMLDTKMFLRRLKELGALVEVYLSGGEPFEHPDLVELVRASRCVAGAVVIYSSGVWMGTHGSEALPWNLIRDVAVAGVSRIDLSMYAAQAAAHDAITRTEGSFEQTLETARRLRAEGISVGIHYVPIGAASGELIKVANLAKDLMASRLHVLALAPQGRGLYLEATHGRPKFLEQLEQLRAQAWPFEIVLSSEIRQALVGMESTPRDGLCAAFLDVKGFLYPDEGQRLVALRSRSSMSERTLQIMHSEIATPG